MLNARPSAKTLYYARMVNASVSRASSAAKSVLFNVLLVKLPLVRNVELCRRLWAADAALTLTVRSPRRSVMVVAATASVAHKGVETLAH